MIEIWVLFEKKEIKPTLTGWPKQTVGTIKKTLIKKMDMEDEFQDFAP
jgi:hypothetical protein